MFWVGLTVLEPLLDYGTEVLGSSPFFIPFGGYK